jgi:hypothetical protein
MQHTDLAGFMDMSRLDTHLASKRVNDTWAVGSYQTRLGLALERVHNLLIKLILAGCPKTENGEGVV